MAKGNLYWGNRAWDTEVKDEIKHYGAPKMSPHVPTHSPLIPEIPWGWAGSAWCLSTPHPLILSPTPFWIRARGLKGSFANVGSLELGRRVGGKKDSKGKALSWGKWREFLGTRFWRSQEKMNPKAEGPCQSPWPSKLRWRENPALKRKEGGLDLATQ